MCTEPKTVSVLSLMGLPWLKSYIAAGDPRSVNRKIGSYCDKGERAVDIGLHELGYKTNIERKLW